jgi:ribosomal protein S18 acetylase RimI-like enzyme
MSVVIRRARDLQLASLQKLIAESEVGGFRHLLRLRDEWLSGQNRFDREGEALFIAEAGVAIVGLCGLNRSPFDSTSRTGRVRRLYVANANRRQGIGTALVSAILEAARPHFAALEVRTNSREADAFYRALGFVAVLSEHATHKIELNNRRTTRA